MFYSTDLLDTVREAWEFPDSSLGPVTLQLSLVDFVKSLLKSSPDLGKLRRAVSSELHTVTTSLWIFLDRTIYIFHSMVSQKCDTFLYL